MTEKTNTQPEANPSRRRFLAGAAAGSAAAAATIGGIGGAQANIGNMDSTPIIDTLSASEVEMLTPAVRDLTELQVLLYNWKVEGHGESDLELTDEDIQSLERAFVSRDKRLYGIESASLAPNMVNSAFASTSCCCCPASCCTASVGTQAVRTRRVIV